MSHQLIALNKLVISDANVRRTDRKADLQSLMASILAHGLLQNLSVRTRDDDHFEVVAGGRRHAALKALAKNGDIERDHLVACNIIESGNAKEASLAENVQRVAMNAIDEAEAFQSLASEGAAPEAIAQRFGVNVRHVEQRMALALLSPKVKSAYKRGEVTLEAARAFCIEPHHAKQDAALKILGKPITHAAQVRSVLTEGAMKSEDRIPLFVGLETYENAGGALTRDLFDDGTIIIADPDLMTRLGVEKLDSLRDQLLASGWGWVEAGLTPSAGSMGGRRIHPHHRAMTRAEKKKLGAIDARIEAIDTALDAPEAENEDVLLEERDQLDAERDALMATLVEWDKDEIAHAGVVIGIDYAGRVNQTFGVVRKADEPALKQLAAKRTPAEGEEKTAITGDDALAVKPPRQTSKALTRELTAARAVALRAGLADHPVIGLAVVVYAILHAWRTGSPVGVDIRCTPIAFQQDEDRPSWLAELPEDHDALLQWCLTQTAERLIAIAAAAAGRALDLVHEANGPVDDAKQRVADALAAAMGLDMREHWQGDLSFWSRLSKQTLLQAIEQAPTILRLSEKRRDKQLQLYAKMKRDDLAKATAKALKGAGWLPEVLITPAPAGALELTEEGETEAAAIAAE